MAPAWFQQAHEVGGSFFLYILYLLNYLQKSNKLEVSAELMKDHTLEWLEKQMQTSAIIGGILSIIHPELYSVGVASLRSIAENPRSITKGHRLTEVLRVWSAPFTAITAISNRDTPYHRDNGSAHAWFDILVPVGNYENGRLELPGLGMRFKYDPGTVVALAGRVLQHGANCPGDRACIAYHMRENVVQKLGLGSPSWENEPICP